MDGYIRRLTPLMSLEEDSTRKPKLTTNMKPKLMILVAQQQGLALIG